jgi:hypothetical protein
LLRESGLLERREQFQQVRQRSDFSCKGWGSIAHRRATDLAVRLRKYRPGQLAGCDGGDVTPTHLLVPEGRILGDVARWLGVEGWRRVCMCATP